MRQDASGCQEQRKTRTRLLVSWNIVGDNKFAFAPNESVNVHRRRPVWRISRHRPLQRTLFVQPVKRNASKGWRQSGDFVHDFGWMGVIPIKPHCLGEPLRHFPILKPVHRRHHLAHRLDTAFGVGEGAVLLQEGRSRQKDMRVMRGFVEEKIMDDHAFHRRQSCRDMRGVGVGMEDVLALNIQRLEHAIDRRIEHVGDTQARFGI